MARVRRKAEKGIPKVLRVRNWNKLYENNRTRGLKRMEWVPVPNRMDGDGFTELLDHPNGVAHFGCWNLCLQVASRCDPRGVLVRTDGRPHDAVSLARITRAPAAAFEETIPRLLTIGWLEAAPQESAIVPHESAVSGQESAVPLRPGDYGMEGNGTGGNDKDAHADTGALPLDQFFEERYSRHPKKRDRILAEQALAQIRGIQTIAVQERFRNGHEAWIATDEYQWKSGAKCPTFAAFITDRTWEYAPRNGDSTPIDSYIKVD